MKHIDRWGLMRNTFSDNLAEHSLDTAVLAHALCLIGNEYFGKELDAERCAVLALFHDAGEIITGDMPTPIKYRSEALRSLYREVEESAEAELVSRLPEKLRPHYSAIFSMEEDAGLRPYVKAADKLSAYIKCLQETQSGNREFSHALAVRKKPFGSCTSRKSISFLKPASPPSLRTWMRRIRRRKTRILRSFPVTARP